ncbi:NAD(P)/FAD-dependent oxidoreductase [Aerococcaceae bacterium DSM 111176]|nr:NAD(P)/FAD-dependent oxidoreductase [Aerococcaceae bacterium DSM 111176]
MTKYDVIVVGAGSSGLMAAINAATQGAKVILIDKNPRPGRKLVISGGGRCNVTNRTTREDLITHIPGNGKFLYSALDQFDQEDIIHFFESRGVALKEEDHGRMFPVTDRARTILDTLTGELEELGVEVRQRSTVSKVLYDKDLNQVSGIELENGDIVEGKAIVLAAGGRAYPRTGATGDGYAWARAAGHTIERLYPTESPILSHDALIKRNHLKGVSLRDVRVTLWNGPEHQKSLVEHQMDMVITHFGYSGPAILRTSGHVNQYLHDENAETAYLSINLVPNLTEDEFKQVAEENRNKQMTTILKQWMPEKMAEEVLWRSEIEKTAAFKQLTHAQIDSLWNNMTVFTFTAYGTQPIEKGFVTGGGVSTKEVNPRSMESKLMAGLFFCGELLDINGYTGGYNITAAFVTGTIAGQNAAWTSFSL